MPSVSDDFAGTGALSGDWTAIAGTVARASDQAQASSVPAYARWSGANTLGADVDAIITLGSALAAAAMGVALRFNWGTLSGLIVAVGTTDGGRVTLSSVAGGAPTTLGGYTNGSWAAGDLVGVRVIDTTAQLLWNGVAVGDPIAVSSSSDTGVGITFGDTTCRMDAFDVSDYVAPVGVSIPVIQHHLRQMGIS